MLWRAITSLPVVAVLSLIFIRTRRLLPLIVAQWTADTLAVLVITGVATMSLVPIRLPILAFT
jgi:hypothetical protein